MGKRPEERELRRESNEVLDRVRSREPVPLKLTHEEKQRLLSAVGTTPEAVDELLALETEE